MAQRMLAASGGRAALRLQQQAASVLPGMGRAHGIGLTPCVPSSSRSIRCVRARVAPTDVAGTRLHAHMHAHTHACLPACLSAAHTRCQMLGTRNARTTHSTSARCMCALAPLAAGQSLPSTAGTTQSATCPTRTTEHTTQCVTRSPAGAQVVHRSAGAADGHRRPAQRGQGASTRVSCPNGKKGQGGAGAC